MVNVAGLLWLFHRGHSWATIRADIFDTIRQNPVTQLSENGNLPSADIQRMIFGITLAAVISLLTFRVAQPYAFADAALIRETAIAETGTEPNAILVAIESVVGFNPQWRANMDEIQNVQGPDYSAPFALQWTDRAPILFPFTNMVMYGMGITAGLMAWVGVLWALSRTVRGRPDWMAHALPMGWSLFYFAFMGTRWVTSTRYFLPIYPTMLLMGAWALWELLRRARESKSRLRPLQITGAGALVIAVVVPSYLWATAYMKTYTEPMTRIEASSWILDNVPSGVSIHYTADGVERQIQLPMRQFEFSQNNNRLFLREIMPVDGTITAVQINYAAQQDPSGVRFELSYNDGTNIQTMSVEKTLTNERQPILFDLDDTAVSANKAQELTITLLEGNPVFADGSHIYTEHWDDSIPVGVDGRNAWGSYFVATGGGPLPVTHLDSPQKREDLMSWLDESDYIVLSSQRALWSLPRIPGSFPMMITFYENLFAGNMGYELVADFHADFQAGPLYLSDTTGQFSWGAPPVVGWPPPGDLAAEEAFSIYDHPPVWVFAKTDNYSRENALTILGQIDLSPNNVTFMTPGDATNAKNGLLLSSDDLALQRQNGTFSEIFNLNSRLATDPVLASIVWWLAIVGIGWLAFPLTAFVLRGLPDKGFAFARILGLLLISYFWLADGQLPMAS